MTWSPDELSDDMVEKVHDLVSRGAVALVAGEELRHAIVHGDSGWWEVHRNRDRMVCDCFAGSTGVVCAHQLAAGMVMVEWQEAWPS